MEYTVLGILQARILEWAAIPFSREPSQPRDRIQEYCIEVEFLPTEPPGKPQNTGVGSLSLLQGIFPTQGQYPGLPYRRHILYHLKLVTTRMFNYLSIALISHASTVMLKILQARLRQNMNQELPDV